MVLKDFGIEPLFWPKTALDNFYYYKQRYGSRCLAHVSKTLRTTVC